MELSNIIENIINTTLNSFDLTYCLLVNILTSWKPDIISTNLYTYSLNPTFENLQFVSDFVYNAESKAQMRQLYNSYARKNPNSKHAKELNKIRRDSIF